MQHRQRPWLALVTVALALGGVVSACSGSVVIVQCEQGLESCDGDCANLSSDPGNCGACGNACGDGLSCNQGTCGTSECAPPDVTCEGVCADLLHDHANCGGCGLDCGALFCENGGCVAACSPSLTPCDGACVDTQTDPDNCGNCAIECPSVCVAGFCADGCSLGLSECNGVCVDTSNDEQNCGGCSIPCGFDQVCSIGICVGGVECPPDLTNCFGDCVDIFNDPGNCGFCGNDCGPGASCQNAGCSISPCDEQVCGICEVAFLPSTVPFSATGNTTFTSDFFTPPCTGTKANEVLHVFTAPSDGLYSFDSIGTEFDAVLSLLDPGSCGVIDCNDDTFGLDAQIVTFLSEGESVFIVMDGFDNGVYELNVSSAACNDTCGACGIIDLPFNVPQTFSNSSAGAVDSLFPSCALGSGGEVVHSFVAPQTSNYTFSTAGSGFDTVLTVLDPFSCAEFACNDNFGGFATSSVTLPLGIAQQVLISVDANGAGGFYNLSINNAIVPNCPTSPLGSALPIDVSGSTTGASNDFTPSCSPGSSAPEHTFSFTAPLTKQYTIDTIGSSYDTVLHVLDGTCVGSTLACDDDAGGGGASLVTPFLGAGQTVTIIVDGFGASAGSYQLHVQ